VLLQRKKKENFAVCWIKRLNSGRNVQKKLTGMIDVPHAGTNQHNTNLMTAQQKLEQWERKNGSEIGKLLLKLTKNTATNLEVAQFATFMDEQTKLIREVDADYPPVPSGSCPHCGQELPISNIPIED
jgi:hypothetical protein